MLIVVRGILCKFVVVSGHQDSASATRKGVVVSTLGEPNCRKFVCLYLVVLVAFPPTMSESDSERRGPHERTNRHHRRNGEGHFGFFYNF